MNDKEIDKHNIDDIFIMLKDEVKMEYSFNSEEKIIYIHIGDDKKPEEKILLNSFSRTFDKLSKYILRYYNSYSIYMVTVNVKIRLFNIDDKIEVSLTTINCEIGRLNGCFSCINLVNSSFISLYVSGKVETFKLLSSSLKKTLINDLTINAKEINNIDMTFIDLANLDLINFDDTNFTGDALNLVEADYFWLLKNFESLLIKNKLEKLYYYTMIFFGHRKSIRYVLHHYDIEKYRRNLYKLKEHTVSEEFDAQVRRNLDLTENINALKYIQYWLHKGYTRLRYSFIILPIFLYFGAKNVQNIDKLNAGYFFIPPKFYSEVIFKDLIINWELSSISASKVLAFICHIFTIYFIFIITKTIKNKFGFKHSRNNG